MNKLKIWEERANLAKQHFPLKKPKHHPSQVMIAPSDAKFLKIKALHWMITQDKGWKIAKQFLKHPFKYGFNLFKSLLKKEAFTSQEGDLFLYNTPSLSAFKESLKDQNTFVVIGFSFCQKPFECPSGRFSTKCAQDLNNPVCQQCSIGKIFHLLPDTFPQERYKTLSITTVHYIGEEIFKTVHEHKDKKVLFIISACELTLRLFGDLGNMVKIQGIGVRLQGRICNTLKAFALAEEGTKPGLTEIAPETEEKLLSLINVSSAFEALK
jgi:hypothetical protein